jgi:hypothetical protein
MLSKVYKIILLSRLGGKIVVQYFKRVAEGEHHATFSQGGLVLTNLL